MTFQPHQSEDATLKPVAPTAEQLLDGAQFIQHRGGGIYRTCAEWDAAGVFVPLAKWQALTKHLAGVGVPAKTALVRFNECEGDKEPDPLERLRFFCSLAMNGQDWLDVEQFFDAVRPRGVGVPAADYLAKVEADPKRAAALQRARQRGFAAMDPQRQREIEAERRAAGVALPDGGQQ